MAEGEPRPRTALGLEPNLSRYWQVKAHLRHEGNVKVSLVMAARDATGRR